MQKYIFQLPPKPAGRDYARDTFWHRYRARFAEPIKQGRKVKDSAFAWFDREERRAKLANLPFPPPPVFGPVYSQPIPWDGMEEKPGRVPRK